MNAKEMEQWLIKKGAVPISKKIKKKPWYKEVSKLPFCLKPSGVGEDPSDYNIGKNGSANQTKKNKITNWASKKLFLQLSNAVRIIKVIEIKSQLFTFNLSPFTNTK